MKNNIELGRREFLKKALSISVLSLACPHFLRGELAPTEITDSGDGKIQNIYTLDLEQYPELKELWGSIRISVPRNAPGESGKMEELIITHVDYDEYGVHFSALNTLCPHEGNRVMDLQPDLHIFECSGHSSLFSPVGIFIGGPAAENLMIYYVSPKWEPGDRYVYITLEFYDPTADPNADVSENSCLSYLRKNYPNPFKESTNFAYGIEKDADVDLGLYDLSGKKVATIVSGHVPAGSYTESFNGSSLPVGLYLCKLFVNGSESFTMKVIKQ
ncbi:MAG: T9SS type A sorting domain-containing protein [Candidatus Kapabacteria bacterium]|nr:T9SS type A sorting domain-containing protein [Candidatus Kapabacteria bacterium]